MKKLKEITKKVNNSDFGTIAENLFEVFPDCKVFLLGGSLSDLYHDEEPHDYDPAIFGVTYEELLSKLDDEFNVVSSDKNELFVEYYDRDLQETVDLHILAPRLFNPLDDVEKLKERYQYQMKKTCNVSFEAYMEECLNSDESIYTAGNLMVGCGPSKTYCLNRRDIEDLTERNLRLYEPERLSFSIDPIFRVIKKLCTGYNFTPQVEHHFIKDSKIDYILWANDKVEKDLYSLLRDRFLATLMRVSVQNELEGSIDGDFNNFIELVEKCGVLREGFDIEINTRKREFNSKEEVLLYIFETKSKVRSVFSDNYLFKNFYSL